MPRKVDMYYEQCLACPAAWVVQTSDGSRWYVRYRWGHLTVREELPSGRFGEEILEKQIGSSLDGYMELDEMMKVTGEVFDFTDAVEVFYNLND